MKTVNYLSIILFFFSIQAHSDTISFYHILEFTTSDPIIKERCVEHSRIKELNCGYVKEIRDSKNRCIRLEFNRKEGEFFTEVDLPSIVSYTWTKNSLIEELLEADNTPF